MSEQGPEAQPTAAAGATLAAITWPWVAVLGLVLGATLAAPLVGADPGAVLAAAGAVLGGGALAYSRQSAKQTNGVLDERMRAAVAAGIAAALDGQPPAVGGGATGAGESRAEWTAGGYPGV